MTSPCKSMESIKSSQNSARSFMIFSQLPTELRLKIWTLCFEPRIIELRLKWRRLPNNIEAIVFNSFCPPPITLSVNSESRYETLRHYHLAFESKDYYPNTTPRIYLNFSLDTIYLDSQTFDLLDRPHRPPPHVDATHPLLRFLDSTTKTNSEKIQHLAIDENIWLANPDPEDATNLPSERDSILAENAKAIHQFSNLKELIIVHHGVNIAVPCAYSYLRTYELHKLYLLDKKNRWPLCGTASFSQQLYYQNPSLSYNDRHLYPECQNSADYNTTDPDVFVRYLDKPAWTPVRKPYSPVLRGRGMGVRNSLTKREWDKRFNEIGEVPIYGPELEALERAELRFFELEGEGGGDFMDGIRRGCVEEDRKALEREGEGIWKGPEVRSVGLIRGGEEC